MLVKYISMKLWKRKTNKGSASSHIRNLESSFFFFFRPRETAALLSDLTYTFPSITTLVTATIISCYSYCNDLEQLLFLPLYLFTLNYADIAFRESLINLKSPRDFPVSWNIAHSTGLSAHKIFMDRLSSCSSSPTPAPFPRLSSLSLTLPYTLALQLVFAFPSLLLPWDILPRR